MCPCDELNHLHAERSGWDAVGPLIRAKQEQLAALREANDPEKAVGAAQGAQELSEAEQKTVNDLKARDREVRAHEQAHASVGGQYAGAPSYTYQSGPDGRRYATGGEVPIDVSPVKGNPEATIDKMRVVMAAALAPAEPSSQDRKVASLARAQQAQAYAELSRIRSEERSGAVDIRG